MCDNGIARNLDIKAHGHNNDGIDLEMTRNFLVENCIFDQGDDAVVIKSGSNQDGWRLNTPCENIVIRNCSILQGHTLLGLGSELSSGIRNIYMHNCTAPKSVLRLFYIKTNHRRGGFVENIYMENIKAGKMQRAFEIDTDVLYQWKDFPTYETRITPIHNIHMTFSICFSNQPDAPFITQLIPTWIIRIMTSTHVVTVTLLNNFQVSDHLFFCYCMHRSFPPSIFYHSRGFYNKPSFPHRDLQELYQPLYLFGKARQKLYPSLIRHPHCKEHVFLHYHNHSPNT